ncbi:MAG TPA: endo-1,4-beta-xylanase [Tepidisphaeraceae bacterium]|jgi:GH35 family endo-1,4-beta-xylanase|nr:endo-1,4-beta-xylanase [Tepidisphaeraceae bacterium]
MLKVLHSIPLMLTALATFAAVHVHGAAEPMMNGDDLDAFRLMGSNARRCEMTQVAVDGQPFTTALRINTNGPSHAWYDIQLMISNAEPIKKGDVLHARFSIRAEQVRTETREATAQFLFQRIHPPHTSHLRFGVGAGGEWQQYELPFRAVEDVAVGEGKFVIALGYDPQVVDVGGMSLRNYGPDVSVDSLPRTRLTYIGREPDAAWRAEAAARIEKHRKADLTVEVRDGDGQPVRDAQVRVQMQRHAFGFGNVAESRWVVGDRSTKPGAERYRQELTRLFNRAVVSGLSWRWWEESGRPNELKTAAWLQSHGVNDLHGTHMVWQKWTHIPTTTNEINGTYNGVNWQAPSRNEASKAEYEAHVKADGKEAAAEWLRQRVRAHITSKVATMAGTIKSWNVVNEHHDNHVLTDILGMEEMVEWFKLARAADPAAKLYLNDYGVIGFHEGHLAAFCDTVKFLLDRGAPLDALGDQSHFGARLVPPHRVLQILDRLSEFNLPIEITEFDIGTEDEQLQADYLRDYLTITYSHPSVRAVVMWGFWQGAHWKANAALFREDWSIKPAGQVYEHLVFKNWWTDASGRSNERGVFDVRGFHGQYEVTVTAGRQTKTVQTSLQAGGTAVRVELD